MTAKTHIEALDCFLMKKTGEVKYSLITSKDKQTRLGTTTDTIEIPNHVDLFFRPVYLSIQRGAGEGGVVVISPNIVTSRPRRRMYAGFFLAQPVFHKDDTSCY